MDLICGYCGKECKNKKSLNNHERLCKLNPNRQYTIFNNIAWQKAKGTNQFIKAKKEGINIEVSTETRLKLKLSSSKHRHSEETKQKISKKLALNNHGGRCKWYKYNNIYLQGTWELSVAKKLDQVGIQWIKTKQANHVLKYYDANNKLHHYNPDFYLPEYDCYLEIKGYWWGNDKQKMQFVLNQNPTKKIYIIEKDLYQILLTVTNKSDFINKLFKFVLIV